MKDFTVEVQEGYSTHYRDYAVIVKIGDKNFFELFTAKGDAQKVESMLKDVANANFDYPAMIFAGNNNSVLYRYFTTDGVEEVRQMIFERGTACLPARKLFNTVIEYGERTQK